MKVRCANCSIEFNKKSAEINRTNYNCCSKKCTGKYKMHLSEINFFDKKVIDSEGCWNFTGSLNKSGYGEFRYKQKIQLAHRVAYMIEIGEIPDDLFVCHSCDNPQCINPSHLWTGTHQDNMDDMNKKGRGYRKNG